MSGTWTRTILIRVSGNPRTAGTSWTEIDDAGIINCGDQLGCGTEQGSYNLELAAVPNGDSGVTDLYAGAINLYKCEIISTSPTCNGTGSNTFLNLTHAYGCSSIAKVHPAQHAVSFLINRSAQDVMYFANDGGIYRALNGYADLTTGTCGSSNQFDSLNMTVGIDDPVCFVFSGFERCQHNSRGNPGKRLTGHTVDRWQLAECERWGWRLYADQSEQ